MHFSTKFAPVCLLALLLGANEARAQDHDHGAASGDAMVIEIDMRDHAFTPATLRIPAGHSVTLVFENTGSVEHEFMAGRGVSDGDFEVDLFAGLEVTMGTVTMAEHSADADHDHAAGAADHDHAGGDHGTMVGLEPGSGTTMTFTLPTDRRGEWEMACFLPRHYERGMHGVLTVY
jgi:uncharacterized cupredoxin-like copper-binding protein